MTSYYVRQHDNLINSEKLDKLAEYSRKISFTPNWPAASDNVLDRGHWNHLVARIPKEPFSFLNNDCYSSVQFRQNSPVCDVWEDILIKLGPRKLSRAYFNLYTYGTEGYIHRDDPEITQCIKSNNLPYTQETILIYLNKTWNNNWAGETIIFDDNDDVIYATLPKYGRVLSFDGYIKHVARSISKDCPENRIIFAFKSVKQNVSPEAAIQFLREVGSNTKHSNSTYFDHCYNTYIKMKEMGLEETICLAGLFHSIYSTEYFKVDFDVPREKVKSLIGDYAEDLVFTFCRLENRIESIKKNSMFNKVKNYHLSCIEYANLLEQHPRTGNKKTEEHLSVLEKNINDCRS